MFSIKRKKEFDAEMQKMEDKHKKLASHNQQILEKGFKDISRSEKSFDSKWKAIRKK